MKSLVIDSDNSKEFEKADQVPIIPNPENSEKMENGKVSNDVTCLESEDKEKIEQPSRDPVKETWLKRYFNISLRSMNIKFKYKKTKSSDVPISAEKTYGDRFVIT